MKTQMKHFAGKIDFWNLFIGLVIGFGAGVILINALVPNAEQLIKMYRLDQKSVTEDGTKESGAIRSSLEIDGK